MVSGTISPFCSKCFSPFPHGTCSLSVSQEYLALPDGAGRFPQGVSDLAVLRIPLSTISLRLRDYHPLWWRFPTRFNLRFSIMLWSYNPGNALTLPVWAISISLATTQEITIVFFSTAYLDVSVRQVGHYWSINRRVSPFGNLRIEGY